VPTSRGHFYIISFVFKRFLLYTDANALSTGAILSQKDEIGEYVISKAS
jgi:hypothetical protein